MRTILHMLIGSALVVSTLMAADNYSVNKEKCAATASAPQKKKTTRKPAVKTPVKPTEKMAWGDAADFTLPSVVDGKPVTLSSFKGKVIILNFWATWCPPCRMELPDFVQLYAAYKDKGLVIVGVGLDEGGAEVINKFMQKQPLNYPVLAGNKDVTKAYGGIQGIPTTFIIDKDGNIKNKIVGARTKEFFEKEIKKYL